MTDATTIAYRSRSELFAGVEPAIPDSWNVNLNLVGGATEAAAYWLLTHLDGRVDQFIDQHIDVNGLLETSRNWASSERIFIYYAADFYRPGSVERAGLKIPGPGTVAQVLDYQTAEILEAAMAMANGRRPRR